MKTLLHDRVRYALVASACLLALLTNPMAAPRAMPSSARAALLPLTVTLPGETPSVVQRGQARLLGVHEPSAPLSVSVGLPLRNELALRAFIANEASRGVYLTRAQFAAAFAPSDAQVRAVRTWATAHGLHATYVSGTRTLITLHGTTGAVAAALHVTINDYRGANGQRFFANAADPSLPAALGVTAVSGLDNIPHLRSAIQRGTRPRAIFAGYTPAEFRAAYDVRADGTRQTIAFTLWGVPLPDSDLAGFAAATGDVPMSTGSGPDQIEWIKTDPSGQYYDDAADELALDVESAHGLATHAHLKYWLAPEYSLGSGGTDVGMEDALAQAADDPSVHIVSNSWLDTAEADPADPFVRITSATFEAATAIGTTFYFATGDAGSDSGGASLPTYPADSPFVVAVGGTTLTVGAHSAYQSESAWDGSGGGCSRVFSRPNWQTGVTAATCTGRAIPDMAADADPSTGALTYFHGNAWVYGGTSLSTPLLAGMMASADRYLQMQGLARLGWTAPLFYHMANDGAIYAAAFHDVTSGSNGAYSAQPGWDETTGWGSLDWRAWVQAVLALHGAGATATPSPTPTRSATASWSATPTSSATASSTATPTTSPTASATRSATQTPSITPTPSATQTSSVTPSPGATGTPTATATGTVLVGSTIAAGWNLIGLPITPATQVTASQLLGALLDATGGHVAALYQLSSAGWSPAILDQRSAADHVTGTDFALSPGTGYLLYSDGAGALRLTGATTAGAPTWTLSAGWNLIAPVAGTQPHASDVLAAVRAGTGARIMALYDLRGGRWGPSRTEIDGVASAGSQDFTLWPGRGYLLYTGVGATVVPGALGMRAVPGGANPRAVPPPSADGRHADVALSPVPALPPNGG